MLCTQMAYQVHLFEFFQIAQAAVWHHASMPPYFAGKIGHFRLLMGLGLSNLHLQRIVVQKNVHSSVQQTLRHPR